MRQFLQIWAVTVSFVSTVAGEDSPALSNYLAKGLPSYNYVTDPTAYLKTLRWVFDSSREEPVLDTTMIVTNGSSEAAEEDLRLVNLRSIISVWRNISEVFHDVALKDRKILDDVCLTIPVGARKLNYVWPSLESMLNIRKVPGDIIYITGLDDKMSEDEKANVKTSLKGNLELLKEQYLPNLPKDVRLRWGVYDGPGGPGVSRWMGSAITDKKYYMVADADDMIGLDAIECRRAFLEKYPNVKHILTSYTGYVTEYVEEYIGLDAERLEKDPTTQMKISFMDIAAQLLNTRINITKAFEQFNFDEARRKVTSSYKDSTFKNGSLVGWPQLQFLDYCEETIQKIKQLDRSGLSKEELADEEESLAWLEKKCGSSDSAEYVGYCANGWAAARTDVFRSAPPTILVFGEDSLTNWVVSQQTGGTVCLDFISSGLYFKGFEHVISKIFPQY